MIREELALVKQNGAWKPRRKKGWSGLFYPPNGLNFQFCWFNLIFSIAPSWSESSFILFYFFIRSELIRSDFCTCLSFLAFLYCLIFFFCWAFSRLHFVGKVVRVLWLDERKEGGNGAIFSRKLSGQCHKAFWLFLWCLTELCSVWYGWKDLFTLHK